MESTSQELQEQLELIAAEEERARQERIRVEKALDQMNLERMEWSRLQDDMYPGIRPEQEED